MLIGRLRGDVREVVEEGEGDPDEAYKKYETMKHMELFNREEPYPGVDKAIEEMRKELGFSIEPRSKA